MLISILLITSILAGQLVKFPLLGNLGPTLLDFFIVVFVILGLFKLRFKLKKPPQYLIAGFIFILVAIISLIFTPLHLQPAEIGISLFYIIRFSSYILSAWLIYADAFGGFKEQINSILISSGFGLAILGLLQFIFLPDLQFLASSGWDPHYFRTVSTFLDPNFSGAFFVLTLILILSLRGPRLWQGTRQSNIFFFLVYLALLTTFSRSSYLMFLISGLTLALLKKSKNLLLTSLILFLILMTGFYTYTQLVAQPRNIDRGKSASSRLNTWQQGWQLFSSHPILGIGFNTYRYGLREFKLGDEQFLQSHGSSSNDSSLLFVAATTGIVGFIAYLFFLISLTKQALTKNLILASTIIGLVLHSFFTNSLFYPPILVWIILITSQEEATSS